MTMWTWLGALAAAAIVLALGYLVVATARGVEDWLELGAIAALALLIGIGLRERRFPRRRRKPPTIRRTPESQ